jgi:hypothetical protein
VPNWQFRDANADTFWMRARGTGASGVPFVSTPQVEGFESNASPPSGNPLLFAGWDGTNVRIIKTDTNGNPILGGITPISGTVQVGQISSVGSITNIAAISGFVDVKSLPSLTVGNTVAVTGQVSVVGIPSVSISNSPTVSVSNTVSTTLASGNISIIGVPQTTVINTIATTGQMSIIGTPSFNVANSPTVTIGNSPAVTLASGNMALIGIPHVIVDGTLPISLASTIGVSGYINQNGTWNFASGNISFNGIQPVSINSSSTIPVTGQVSIVGTPSVSISNTPAVTVNGTVATTLSSGNMSLIGVPRVSLDPTQAVFTTGYLIITSFPTVAATGFMDIKSLPNVTIGNTTIGVSGYVSQNGTWNFASGNISFNGVQPVSISSPISVSGYIGLIANQAIYSTGYSILSSIPPISGQVFTTPQTSGGYSIFSVVHPNNTQSHVVKNIPGQIYGFHCGNVSPYPQWLKVYDSTSGVVGTTTPKLRLLVPGNVTNGGGFNVEYSNGIQFSAGISVGAVSGILDADANNTAASTLSINILYK